MLRRRETQLAGLALLEQLATRDDIRNDQVDSALAGGLKSMGVRARARPDPRCLPRPTSARYRRGRAARPRRLRTREERELLSDAGRGPALPLLQQCALGEGTGRTRPELSGTAGSARVVGAQRGFR